MNRKLIVLTIAILTCIVSEAQLKIGDNETVINAGSLLELESTNKAVTLPRLTTAQMGTIPTPVNGMFIFNTTDQCVYQYKRVLGPVCV